MRRFDGGGIDPHFIRTGEEHLAHVGDRPDAAADSPERQLYDWLDTEAGQACIKKAGYVPAGSAAANG